MLNIIYTGMDWTGMDFKVFVGVECPVEEVVLVVGEVVCHDSIRSASRMNGAVVLFLDKVEKFNDIVVSGIVLNDSFVKIFPLVNPTRKVLLSNVPLVISDEALQCELCRTVDSLCLR